MNTLSHQGPALRALIVDDEGHIRFFLRTLLGLAGFEVAGEGANGNDAVRLYQELKPDVVLMDVNMPFKNGDEALGEILAMNPAAQVIMLTSVADAATVRACIERGAACYIRKDAVVEEIEAALGRVHRTIMMRRV